MRIVVDTNIFASASLKESSFPADVVRWLDQYGGLLKSTATEAQLIEVLQRPYFAARLSPIFREAVGRVLEKAELVPIIERVTACRDHTDDKFLELAVNGRADLIVTGDNDLLVLNPFREIPIVTAAAFVASTVP
jgi:putative PIN family toxin of toxin-antitoxin system